MLYNDLTNKIKTAEAAVAAFVDSADDGYLIAEQLPSYGSVIVEPARRAYALIHDEGKKSLLALLLYALNDKGCNTPMLDALKGEPEGRFFPLLVDSLKTDDCDFYCNILTHRAQTIIERGNYGQSFVSNCDKDALASILDYLSRSLPRLPEQLRHYEKHKDNFPKEVTHYFDANRARKPSMPGRT